MPTNARVPLTAGLARIAEEVLDVDVVVLEPDPHAPATRATLITPAPTNHAWRLLILFSFLLFTKI
jgi:hypothetical protein